MKINSFLIIILGLALQSCSNTTTPEPVVDYEKKVETSLILPIYIQGDSTWTIEERMEHYGVPGVSIAVINDNKIAWTKTYGVMDKDSKSPVTNETLFQAGSISKPVATYGGLTLVENDRLGLETDVNTYLKSWTLPDNEFTQKEKVTLKHLMSHTGGLTVHGFWGYSPDLPVPSLTAVLDGLPPANSGPIRVDKTPGESFRYSGGGYTIMQQMMIDVAGKTFPELMQELVLQPLGMTHSTYDQPLQGAQLEMAATGYLPDGSMTKGKRHTYPEMAAAGLWTNAEDLAKFAVNIQQTLKGESEKGLSKEMTTQMLTPYVEDHNGLGIFINKKKDEVYFGHGGWDEGFSSEMVAHRDKGYGVVVLTNANQPEFISELIRSVALTYNWPNYVPTYEKAPQDLALINEIKGRYSISGNEILEVYQAGNQLYGKELGGDPQALIKVSDRTFVGGGKRLVQFKADEESKMMSMHFMDPATGETRRKIRRMDDDEKLPLEFLVEGNYEESLTAYQALMKEDPNDPTVSEGNLNRLGYGFMNNEKMKFAQDVFKVNTVLYPESANVYDSYAEACMKIGDTELAIENYKKALQLDPQNSNAKSLIEKMEGEMRTK